MQVSDEVLAIRTGNVFHCKRHSPIRKNHFQELSKQHLEGHLVGRQRLRICARCLDARAPNGSLTCLQLRTLAASRTTTGLDEFLLPKTTYHLKS
jgi:hypothetical protein